MGTTKFRGGAVHKKRLTRSQFLWFNVEDYAACELSPRGWFIELKKREFAWQMVTAPNGPLEEEMVRSMLNDPLGKKGTSFIMTVSWPRDSDARDMTVEEGFGISTARYAQRQAILDDIDRLQAWRRRPAQRRSKESPTFDGKYAQQPLFCFLSESTSVLRGKFPVVVSLAAPDEVVVAGFKKWLKAKRKQIGERASTRSITPELLRSWQEYRVLPYIDLMIFCQLMQATATQSLIGELLFPGEEVDTTERVRKVVRPMAEQLIDKGFLISMANATGTDWEGSAAQRIFEGLLNR